MFAYIHSLSMQDCTTQFFKVAQSQKLSPSKKSQLAYFCHTRPRRQTSPPPCLLLGLFLSFFVLFFSLISSLSFKLPPPCLPSFKTFFNISILSPRISLFPLLQPDVSYLSFNPVLTIRTFLPRGGSSNLAVFTSPTDTRAYLILELGGSCQVG